MINRPAASRLTLTRRGLLAAGGAVVLGAASGCTIAAQDPSPAASGPTPTGPTTPPAQPSADGVGPVASDMRLPFHGPHQSGVETRPALLQTFVGLDLRDPSPETADAVLRLVSDDAARLTQGEPALGDTEPEIAASPAGLTITVGLGRPLFVRTGLADQIPEQLAEIPPFETDRLEDRWGQTDLLLQVGSDDAVSLAHAVRMLTKDLSTLAEVRWMQQGFRASAPAVPGSTSTRNLMGQVDGTVNPQPGSPQFEEVVWIDGGPAWVNGGTVLVLRRIRMHLDEWEVLDRETQEVVMGRHIATGAPLGGQQESDPVPFDAVDDNGLPVIPADAHVRVAHAPTAAGMILRRPYSYDEGMHDGTNDVGLLFAAYTRDPRASFIPMQERIAASDAFNRWNTTIGSAAYLIPAGAAEGGYLAEGVFA
jgi:dye decolorizing peroxidase